MKKHHCQEVNRDTVKFMALSSKESLTAPGYFLYKLLEKMTAVYHSEIKAVFPSQKMNYDGLFFAEGTTI